MSEIKDVTPEDVNSLEYRGKMAGEEIAAVLKKYNMGLAVDIGTAQDFISSLKPILIDTTEKNAE